MEKKRNGGDLIRDFRKIILEKKMKNEKKTGEDGDSIEYSRRREACEKETLIILHLSMAPLFLHQRCTLEGAPKYR